jgi:hypothetical protein
LTSALVGGEWSASRLGRFTLGGKSPPGTNWKGCWVGPRTGLDDVEKRRILPLPGLELRPLCRLARSVSLYRLSYRGSCYMCCYPCSNIPTVIFPCPEENQRQSSSFCIAIGYGLDGPGSIPCRGKICLHSIQTSSGAHPASYPMGTRGEFPGGEADYSPTSSAEVKKGGAIPPLPHMCSCIVLN